MICQNCSCTTKSVEKNTPFHWASEGEFAFHQLKELLISGPVLAYPNSGQIMSLF